MSKTVLIVGAGRRERALCRLLCARDDVCRVFLTPGSARLGNAKTRRVSVEPGDAERLMAFALSRDLALIVEGPDGGGLCKRLRGMHSYRVHRPGSADALAAAIWKALPGGTSSAWTVASPAPAAEAHIHYVPIRHECERDKAYLFTLGPKEQST